MKPVRLYPDCVEEHELAMVVDDLMEIEKKKKCLKTIRRALIDAAIGDESVRGGLVGV